MEKNEAQKLSTILNRIKAAETWRDSNFQDKWRHYHDRWRSRPELRRDGSNIFVPYTFMLCDVISSRITESAFASRPYVSVLPRGKTTGEGAEKINALLDWQLAERMHVDRLFNNFVINDLVTYGTVITFTGWNKATRNVKRRVSQKVPLMTADGLPITDQATGQPVMISSPPEVVEGKEVEYDDPVVQSVDIFDFFVDVRASDMKTARFCGHKEYRTRAELKELEKTAGYKIDWKTLDQASVIEDGQTIRYDESGISTGGSDDGFSPTDPGSLYKVHHYWEKGRHCVVLDEAQLVLDEENPFWHGELPYDRLCYIYLPHEFYGMGVVELVSGLQDELNTTRNQRIDYNSMALRRMWKLRKGCGLTAKDLVWRQNGIIQVENMDDVQEIKVQDLPASAFANEANIKQDMKDATGCHDIIMGLANTNETATTTMTKDNNASIRFKRVVESLCEEMLVPVARKVVALDQQYMTEEKVIRVTGTDVEQQNGIIVTVSPWEIEGDYDLLYVGTAVDPMANKELNKQRLMEAVQLMFGDPLYQADPEARIRIYRRIYEAMDQKDVTELTPDVNKFKQMQAQQMQAQQMQQAQMGQAAMQQAGPLPSGQATRQALEAMEQIRGEA